LLMLDPELPEQRQEEIVKRTSDLVKDAGGKWVGHDAWGRRRLAYEIAHKPRAPTTCSTSTPSRRRWRSSRASSASPTASCATSRCAASKGLARPAAGAGAEPEAVPEPAYAEANTSSEEE
jgi:hypothetical protein